MIVSVIIPTLNRRDLAEQALTSVYEQLSFDHTQIEVILIDNASNDSTFELEGFKENLKYIRNSRVLDICANWYSGVDLAQGDYIVILGDDDYFLPGWFEYFVRAIQDNDHPSFVGWKSITYIERNPIIGWENILIYPRAFTENVRSIGGEAIKNSYLGKPDNLGFQPHPSLFAFKKSEIRRVEENFKTLWFDGMYPDYHAGVLASQLNGKGLIIDRPLVCIGGVEQKFYCRKQSKMNSFKGSSGAIREIPEIDGMEESPYLDVNAARQLAFSANVIGEHFDVESYLRSKADSFAENILFCDALFGEHAFDLYALRHLIGEVEFNRALSSAKFRINRNKINKFLIKILGQSISAKFRNLLASNMVYVPLGPDSNIHLAAQNYLNIGKPSQ